MYIFICKYARTYVSISVYMGECNIFTHMTSFGICGYMCPTWTEIGPGHFQLLCDFQRLQGGLAEKLVIKIRSVGVLLGAEQVLLQDEHVHGIQGHHHRLDEEGHVHVELHTHEK